MVRATKLSDRYLLEERLASGGMGAVYAATDERLSRRVAVKLLREELAEQPRFVERFRREAQAVAALSHANIANVFDYGEDDHHYYIVMELVAGRDLSTTLSERAPLDSRTAADIAAQTCDALAAAHAGGVVHRDVKPGNIMVDDNGRVKVTDFGIARAAGQSTLTGTGSVIGTAQYLSPEQASGANIGPRSDLYSLGIVLYEMLTGAVPFTGDTPIGIAMRHVAEDVPAPSTVNPDVPKALDDVIAKATAKDPERRFPSASAMGEALRRATSPTSAAAAVGAGAVAAGGTAVLERPPDEETTSPLGPFGAQGWDRQRIGKAVLLLFGGLALLLLAVLLFRLVSGDDATPSQRAGGRAGDRVDQPAGGGGQDETSAAAFVIPETIIGQSYDDVEETLEGEGFDVDKGEEIPSAEEKDTVLASDPAPGNPVEPGGVITLTVSSGEPAEEDESTEEGDDDSSGPGSSEDAPGKSEKPPKPPKPPKEEKEKDD